MDWTLCEGYLTAEREERALAAEMEDLARLDAEMERAGAGPLLGKTALLTEIRARRAGLDERCRRAREMVEAVGDRELRELAYGRYIEGLEWEKLAERMGKSVKWVYWKWGGAQKAEG